MKLVHHEIHTGVSKILEEGSECFKHFMEIGRISREMEANTIYNKLRSLTPIKQEIYGIS